MLCKLLLERGFRLSLHKQGLFDTDFFAMSDVFVYFSPGRICKCSTCALMGGCVQASMNVR